MNIRFRVNTVDKLAFRFKLSLWTELTLLTNEEKYQNWLSSPRHINVISDDITNSYFSVGRNRHGNSKWLWIECMLQQKYFSFRITKYRKVRQQCKNIDTNGSCPQVRTGLYRKVYCFLRWSLDSFANFILKNPKDFFPIRYVQT